MYKNHQGSIGDNQNIFLWLVAGRGMRTHRPILVGGWLGWWLAGGRAPIGRFLLAAGWLGGARPSVDSGWLAGAHQSADIPPPSGLGAGALSQNEIKRRVKHDEKFF